MTSIPSPPPRRIRRGPDPGAVNITKEYWGKGVPPGWHIRVGPIHLNRRHINTNFHHPVCAICGHPYDHNGLPHSHTHTQNTPRGEALTGPDGLVYNWNGTVWIRRP